MEIAGESVQVIHKRIKNLHIGVYPPNGHVRVAAPVGMSMDAIEVAVLTRLGWIKRQKRRFEAQPRETERRYVSGETHYIFGRPYRLQVVKGASRLRLEVSTSDRLLLHVPEGSPTEARAQVFERWYRHALRERAAPRVSATATRLRVSEPLWGIRRMKTKWGSCNPVGRRIWLSIDLAKKPLHALDYVILHEMTHFISPRHDEAFISTLDSFMPRWRQVRVELNALPLSHEKSFDVSFSPPTSSEKRLLPSE
jgi:predicted metal-dependent hydrolase